MREIIGQSYFEEEDGEFVIRKFAHRVRRDGGLDYGFRVPSDCQIVYAAPQKTRALLDAMFREAGPRFQVLAFVDVVTNPTRGLLRRRSVI